MSTPHTILLYLCAHITPYPGIAVSGGDGDAGTTAEVFVPSTGQSCSLPTLPDDRWYHTMDSKYICGGRYNQTSCIHLDAGNIIIYSVIVLIYIICSGKWTISHNLLQNRYYHCSWETEHGLLLMGGVYSPTTSEIVPTDGGEGGPSFAMKYRTL